MKKKRRARKIEWLKKMYSLGEGTKASEAAGWLNLKKGLDVPIQNREQDLEMIIKDIEQIELDESLLSWPKALDFDSYHNQWLALASTAPSNNGNFIIWYLISIDYEYTSRNRLFEKNQNVFDMENQNIDDEIFITKAPL